MILQTKFELENMNPLGLWSKIYALALDILIVGADHEKKMAKPVRQISLLKQNGIALSDKTRTQKCIIG